MRKTRPGWFLVLLIALSYAGSIVFAGRSPWPRTLFAGNLRSQAPTSWAVDAVLKQLDSTAREFRSLTADIERTKVTVVVNDRSTETGQVWIRHDDKMRIELTRPDPRTILRDGNDLFVFNPKIKRVEQYDLSKRRALVDQLLLLGFGTPGSELRKSYGVTVLGEETLDGQKVVWLELTPKSDEVRSQISKIQLWIDQSTWLPAQQKFFETGSGDYFMIHYANVVGNVRIPDARFKAHWPKGTTKIKPHA